MKLRKVSAILTLLVVASCKESLPAINDICGYNPSLIYFSAKKTYSEKETNVIMTNNCHACEVCFDRLTFDERAVCHEVKELCPKL